MNLLVATFRDLVPTKLAAAVWNSLEKYKSTIPNFPQTGTCELLILDRSIDQIAPVIHEWTYDAMCHDLLDMDGNKYVHEIPSKTGGEPEKKEVLLEDHDPVWLELRHVHIADASERLHDKMTNFVSKNKAAQLHQRDSNELSTRDLQKMVQALPQYSEQMEKLSLHVEIAGKINRTIREMGLRDLGQLEQDLVFGDVGAKEVINFLRTKQDATSENKLRLLMIYASVYPEKFEGDKGLKLMQQDYHPRDMKVVNNMRLLEGSSATKKKSSGGFSLKFDGQKVKNAARKDRTTEEERGRVSADSNDIIYFVKALLTNLRANNVPCLPELIEKLNKGELPKNEYLCMNEPSHLSHGALMVHLHGRSSSSFSASKSDELQLGHVLVFLMMDVQEYGAAIFVFIIGGATRSELRVCHKLTAKLRREVVLGSSSIDDPPQFITGESAPCLIFQLQDYAKRKTTNFFK
ncbi:Protein transport Sec1a [Vitis vinifera]|uniref:Protein transport Sec1a n=1 Tax=Vitis vinifera TaxID=29760 RepID=A0A438FCN6_VITVI|nr:Protein transport Sec1a [Vitis vinifera]